MKTQDWMEKATKAAEDVYKDFLNKVVKVGVFNDRCDSQDDHGWALFEKENQRIMAGKMHDPRTVRLMSISGKGGWNVDANTQQRYRKHNNVTLLSHLLSVTRGSLMLSALDWLGCHPDMDDAFFKRKLYVITVVAFMHEIDKDLGLSPANTVTDEQVAERMARYGINDFLRVPNVRLTPAQLLYLIDKTESQPANRPLPEAMPPYIADETLPLYVQLADKLEDSWLATDSEEGKWGIEGVLDCLKHEQSCIRSDLLRALFEQLEFSSHVIDLFEPHHPFLMDELQRQLSYSTWRLTKCHPVIESHHDGRLQLLILANKQQLAEIKEQAISNLCNSLLENSFWLELRINTRGEPSLLNHKPSHAELRQFFIEYAYDKTFQRLFLVKTIYKATIAEPLYHLLNDLGLKPVFYDKNTQLMMLYNLASLEKMREKATQQLRKAAHAILLLNLLFDPRVKDKMPYYDKREEAFLACIPKQRPNWIETIVHGHSRRVLTVLWAVTVAHNNKQVENAIWGDKGLLKDWLEGTNKKIGFRQFIKADGVTLIKNAEVYVRQLFTGKRIVTEDESAKGRCLFTEQPVNADLCIRDNMGLGKIGIKVTAFSGRDGRFEPLDFPLGKTNISPISVAEYKLRVHVYEKTPQGTRNLENLPTLISSPTTVGLFGGLAMGIEPEMALMSLQQLNEFEVKKSKITGLEHDTGRYRITRLESLVGNTAEQINQLHRLLKATRRIGRPLHVFRGLPTTNRAFFYYDAMPPLLAELLSDGKSSGLELRLEQIPAAIQRLEMAQLLLETQGYGYETLQLYAYPQTHFKGLCLAWCGLHEKSRLIARGLEQEYESYFQKEPLKPKAALTKEEGVMVRLGQAAASIQKKNEQLSHSEQTLVFNLCLDGLKERLKVRQPQTGCPYLSQDIAHLLIQTLARSGLKVDSHNDVAFHQACLTVASQFVEEFWLGVMNKHFPSQSHLRILSSIYRMSFMLQAA